MKSHNDIYYMDLCAFTKHYLQGLASNVSKPRCTVPSTGLFFLQVQPLYLIVQNYM